MACVDPNTDAIVIRIIYDGAPMAGKTTSVRALGNGLGVQAVSPAEIGGRTLYFDWLDYTGGLFEGRRIRCQIVSVPGQATLAPRRRRLLESADAIVFVSDSTPAGFAADRGYLRGLTSLVSRMSSPAAGIVLQANKRDVADAISISDLRSMLDDLSIRVGIVESVATDGTGIREAFVLAVRLALDRVRELMRLGKLQITHPVVDNADELLRELRKGEGGALDFAAASGLTHTRLTELSSQCIVSQAISTVVTGNQDSEAAAAVRLTPKNDALEPVIPDDRVATGMIWPPIEGRAVLNEFASAQVALQRLTDGGWSTTVNGRWRLQSSSTAVFDSLEAGRTVLVHSARMHAANPRGSGVDRCVSLAPDGHGRFRLWQIERIGT